MQWGNHPCCQALPGVPGPTPSHHLKNITPSYLLSPVLLYYHFFFSVRSFPSVYENVICSGLLNLPLNPHLQSQVCPIFVLLFTKHNKTKQTNQAAKYMSIFAVFIFSPQFIQLILIRLSAPQLYLNCHCHGINVHLAMSKGHFSVLSSY